MKKILILLTAIFLSAPASGEIKYKTYDRLPCSFNGAKVRGTAIMAFGNFRRCEDFKGYPTKRGTSVAMKRGTPIFAITDMTLLTAKDRTSMHDPRGKFAEIYDDVELIFFDKDKNLILFYHLMDTPFVPGFGKGSCETPIKFDKVGRSPGTCGGYTDELIENKFRIKKGDLIGHSGQVSKSGKYSQIAFSFIMNRDNLTEKENKLCNKKIKRVKSLQPTYKLCYKAPEGRKDITWENFPTDSDQYLLPVVSKKYYEEIGYIK